MSDAITVDFHDLASVRVSRYRLDERLRLAEVRFRVQSHKTRRTRTYSAQVAATADMLADPDAASQAVTAAAWEAAFTAHREHMVAFVAAETEKPNPMTAYQVPTVLPPSWQTAPCLGEFAARRALTVVLSATLADAYSVSDGALPSGLRLDSVSGELSGTPLECGASSFTVSAHGATPSLVSTRTFTLHIERAPEWETPPALPDGEPGDTVSLALLAPGAARYGVVTGGGGDVPCGCGRLPPGLTLSGCGVLSGVLRCAGSYAFTVRAAAGAPGTAGVIATDRTFTLAIGRLPVWRTVADLPPAVTGVTFMRVLSAESATAYELVSGDVPLGSDLSPQGVLSGVVEEAGAFAMTVRATSPAASKFATRTFYLRSAPLPEWSPETPAALPACATGEPVEAHLHASGALSYELVDGELPSGVAFDGRTGELSGAPEAAGDYSFTVRAASEVLAISSDRAFGLQVVDAPEWRTAAALPDAAAGEPMAQLLEAFGAARYGFVSGALPLGTALSSGGLLSGVPSTLGPHTFVARASSVAARVDDTRAFVISVARRPVWATPAQLPALALGESADIRLEAESAVTFTLACGSLPAGVRLSRAGALSGEPAAVAASTFTVRAASTAPGVFVERTFALRVARRPAWPADPSGVGLLAAVGEDVQFRLGAAHAGAYELASAPPPHLALARDGALAGVPASEGVHAFRVAALDLGAAAGKPDVRSECAFLLHAMRRPEWLTPAALPDALRGSSVSLQLAAHHAARYEVAPGGLPPGLLVTEAGVLEGTPTTSARGAFTVTAFSAQDVVSAERTFAIVVADVPVWVSGPALQARRDVREELQLSARHAETFGLVSGVLPAGLAVSPAGLIHGTATEAGTFRSTMRAVSAAASLHADLDIAVTCAPMPRWTTPRELPLIVRGEPLGPVRLSAEHAAGYQLFVGELPPGAGLTGDVLWGPTAPRAGTYSFTVRALTGASSVSADREFVWTVAAPPAWRTPHRLPDAAVERPLSLQLLADGADSIELRSGALPRGVGLSPEGLLSGVPTADGWTDFTLRASSPAPAVFSDRTFRMLAATPPAWRTEPGLPDAALGSEVALRLDADHAAYVELVEGALPAGLGVDPGGLISGTPSAAGPASFTLVATGASPLLLSYRTFTLLVGESPAWRTEPGLPDARRGAPMSLVIRADGATGFELARDTLPPAGLSLTREGVLAGVPERDGTAAFAVRALSEAPAFYSERSFRLLVATLPAWATPARLPDMRAGVQQALQLQAVDAASFAVTSGALPAGLELSPLGLLYGAPAGDGATAFTVRAASASEAVFVDRSFEVRVETTPEWLTGPALPDAALDEPFALQLIAVDGDAYDLLGEPPAGLALSAGGLLSGIPDEEGSWSFKVRARSTSSGIHADRTFQLLAARRPDWGPQPAALADQPAGTPLSLQLSAAGARAYALSAGALPEGARLTPAGRVEGAAPRAGECRFTVRAAGASAAVAAERTFTLMVVDVPRWATASHMLLFPDHDGRMALQLTAVGAWTYEVESGVLPPGLELTPAGLLAGAPLDEGTWDFTVLAVGARPGFTESRLFQALVQLPLVWQTGADLGALVVGEDAVLTLAASRAETYTVWDGSPPAGTRLLPDGRIVGAPSARGAHTFSVRAASRGGGLPSDREFTLLAVTRPSWLTEPALLLRDVGGGVSTRLAATDAGHYALESGAPPPGLELAEDGLLHGSPLAGGTWTFEARATSAMASGVFAVRTFVAEVETAPAWRTAPGLPAVIVGRDAAFALDARDAALYEVAEGSPPPGMTLRRDGVLTGVPEAESVAAFKVRALSASGLPADRVFELSAVSIPVWASDSVMRAAPAGGPMAARMQAAGAVSFAVAPGASNKLPPGLLLSDDGVLSGTPEHEGAWQFQVRAQGAAPDAFALKTFTLEARLRPEWRTAAELGAAELGAPLASAVEADHAESYALVAGALPEGVKIADDGALYGTPTRAGECRFTVRAIAGDVQRDRAFLLRVAPRPAWVTEPDLPWAAHGADVSLVLEAAGAEAYDAAELPAGLSLSPAGHLRGIAPEPGTHSFRVVASLRALAAAGARLEQGRAFTFRVRS